MNDLVILGFTMSGVIILTGLILYFLQNRQFRESHIELKMFQMELARQNQKNQEENRKFFKTHGLQLAQIYEQVEREEGEGGAK